MKYRAKPVIVDAFAIKHIKGAEGVPGKTPIYHLTLDSGEEVIATSEMTARMEPKPGDYWVIQSDGYIYLNPKEVFERKYEKI